MPTMSLLRETPDVDLVPLLSFLRLSDIDEVVITDIPEADVLSVHTKVRLVQAWHFREIPMYCQIEDAAPGYKDLVVSRTPFARPKFSVRSVLALVWARIQRA